VSLRWNQPSAASLSPAWKESMMKDEAHRKRRPDISAEDQLPGAAPDPRDMLDRPSMKRPGGNSAQGRRDGE
jgi:hypothetical protein